MSMDQTPLNATDLQAENTRSTDKLALSGGAPVALPTGPSCWHIESGRVEAYLTWPEGRQLLSVLDAGGMAFGLGQEAPRGAAISLVTAEPAHLMRIDTHKDMAEQADHWIKAACSALNNDQSDATLDLDHTEPEAIHDGDVLTSPRTVRWLSPGPGLVLDQNNAGDITLAPDLVCVHGPLWVRSKGRGTTRIRATEDLGTARIPAAIASFAAALIPLLEAQEAQADADALSRIADQTGTDGSHTDPTQFALNRIADHFGIKPEDRANPPANASRMPLSALARTAGFRARKITLEQDWHRYDHGPLLVRAQDQTIEALIWDGKSYTNAQGRLTPAQANEVPHTAFTISTVLPMAVKGIWSLAWHVMRAGNRRDATYASLAAAGTALLGILTPLATGWLLSDIVPAGMLGLLIAVGIALAISALISTTLGIARTYATTRIEGRGATVLGASLTDRLLRLPTRFFKEFSAGDLNQRLENVEQMRQLAVSVLMSAGLTAVLSVVYLIVLLFYDARLAAMGIGLVTVYILAVILARVLQMEAIRDAAHLDGEIAGLTFETLEGVGKLRSAAAEERAMLRWLDVYRRERAAGVRAGRVGVNFGAFADTYQTVTLMTLFAGAMLLATMEASAGVFIAFLAAFGSFQGAIVGLSQALLQVYTAQPLVERARPILEAKAEVDPGRTDPGVLRGAIEGSGLSFAYAEGLPPILNNLSFEVKPGQHMAIVGGSGSGKSTLLRLLLGFEAPQRGSILYDGQDLSRLDLTRVRSQIGVVLQASQLFAGSILENIRGATNAPLEDCLRAVEKAGLARDLQTFAMGIHTPVTEGAGTLSGGQRQRILIARALAAQPNILFFDEATSALDNATQAVVSNTLDQLQVTRITIAHRLSTVRNADTICVLQDGKFIERGTFDDLMTLDGTFAALARRQLK